MKLREEDRKRLISWGYALEDIPQIEKASRRDKTIYTMGGSPISREEAVNVLGWQEYLSGLARGAFHLTAARTGRNGSIVIFDSYRLYGKE